MADKKTKVYTKDEISQDLVYCSSNYYLSSCMGISYAINSSTDSQEGWTG
jgi:hypothetical protein